MTDLDFHIVAEVSQRFVRNGRSFYGGASVILDEEGQIRPVIRKSVRNQERHAATDRFLARAPSEYRQAFEGKRGASSALIRRFHVRKEERRSAA